MTAMQYQRPREKLQTKGVATLSLSELLQIIIGSGTVTASAASIARRVETIWRAGDMQYQTLVELEGVGQAKACLLVAVAALVERGFLYDTHDRRPAD